MKAQPKLLGPEAITILTKHKKVCSVSNTKVQPAMSHLPLSCCFGQRLLQRSRYYSLLF